jgi:quinol monooxygenase YgiN
MTIARHYIMIAAENQGAALGAALQDLATRVRPIPGCEGVELLHDTENPVRYVFIEKWASVEAHKAASQHLPKDALAPVMATLAGRPEGSYLEYTHTI